VSGERPFVLGDWLVDPSRGVLVKDGAETRLEPQAMALLLLFAGAGGKVVSKDEIVASVWHGRAIGDDTLAAAVSKLRTALGETKDKRYIETLPKRGYRLLVTPEGAAVAPKPSSDAANLIARGRAAMKLPSPSSLAQARVYFEGAITAEPRSADAQLGLAEVLLLQNFMGQGDASVLLSAARTAARAALALDDALAAGWSALGYATLLIDRDFAAADAHLRKAIALDPSLAMARRHRSFALLCVGRFVDAEREARAGAEADPYSLAMRGYLLQALLVARRYVQAVAEAKKALALSSQASDAWFAKGWGHHFLGEEREAVDAFIEGMKGWNADAATIAQLKDAYAAQRFAGLCAATADLFQAQHVVFAPRSMDIALLRAFAGDPDAAFAALDDAVAKGDPFLLLLPHMPYLDRLRNDPRFTALLERVSPVR
jgi:DNA-binding winged helix-turn-helix (wHTH) protein